MNRHTAVILLGLGLTFGTSNGWSQTRELGSSGELLDGIAALVEDGVVLKSEIAMRLELVVTNFRDQQSQLTPEQRTQLPPLSVLESQVLEQLILEQIQLQRAERLGIVVGDDILNEILSDLAGGLGIALEQLPAALASEGIDYTIFREQQRQEVTINQLERRDVYNRIGVSPRELQQCLVRSEATQSNEFDYNVSHILIGFSPEASQDTIAAAEERIMDIKRQLDEGADFAQLALSFSESQTALEGGALGWRKGSELPTIFADVVIRMEPETHSDPIRTSSGFHLVRLNDNRGAERVVVDQVLARHILLSPNEILDNDATEQKLIGIRNQIVGGDDFATVASSVSEDTVSAADGGDLGWVEANVFVEEFQQKLQELSPNELSEPFQTRFGWHILEVLERRSYDTTDEVKEANCRTAIGNSKAEEERELWLRRLRDEAYIVNRL